MRIDLKLDKKFTCAASFVAVLSCTCASGLAEDPRVLEQYKKSLALQDDDEIIKWSTQIIQGNTKNALAYTERAHALCQKKKYQAAVADATRAIELNPKLAKAYVVRGKAGYMGESSSQQVLKDLQMAVKLDPSVEDGYFLLGVACSVQKQGKEAIDAFTKAAALKPKDKNIYRYRSAVFTMVGDNQNALKDISTYIGLLPTRADGYVSRAGIHEQLHQFDKALVDYSDALKVEPKQYPTRMMRAQLYSTLNKHREAIADYSECIKQNPMDEDLFLRRGKEYQALKEYDKAVQDFNESIGLAPEYGTAYRLRGRAYEAMGKKDLAAKDKAKADEISKRPAEKKI